MLFCKKDIPLREKEKISDYMRKKFCNLSCSASYNNSNKKQENKCLNCGKPLLSNKKYCSAKCQQSFQYKNYIERWKEGKETGVRGEYGVSKHIRRYLFEKYENKCSLCKWGEMNPFSGKIPLEVHHKDGDYKNNKEENLELLCPNCHSLTATYKAMNKQGRKGRKKII